MQTVEPTIPRDLSEELDAPEAIALMLQEEGCSLKPEWPGGQSGVTLGHGYDLGYRTLPELIQDWHPYLTGPQLGALAKVIGLTGTRARDAIATLPKIRITRDAAGQVFANRSFPHFVKITRTAMPGVEKLHPEIQGALVSLVYNRGASFEDRPEQRGIEDRRREMRLIRDYVRQGRKTDIAKIPGEIRSMKRLWRGKGLDGLLKRRDNEAALIERTLEKI